MTSPAYDRSGVVGNSVDLAEVVRFHPKQLLAFKTILRHKFTLFGGARGPGKSYWLRWSLLLLLILWAKLGHRDVRVGLFCEDYPVLHDRQLSKAEKEFPAWLGSWNKVEHEFRLHEEYGAGVLCFRNLDKEKDASGSKYQSAEFAAIGVDELTKNTQDKFDALRGSLRWTGIDHTPFLAASNPGSIGHSWVKDIWVDQSFATEESASLLNSYAKSDFAYVKAVAYDNPSLSASYLTMLESLTPRLRAAFLDGNWDVFEGMAFEQWHRDVHIVPNRILPPAWGFNYVAGLDWGMRQLWYGLFAVGPKGHTELVWEAALQRKNAQLAAQIIHTRSQFLPKPACIYFDNQMRQDHGVDEGMTLETEYRKGLVKVYRDLSECPPMVAASKGAGSRKTKYDLFHAYLNWGMRDLETGHISEEHSLREPKLGVSYANLNPWCRPLLTVQRRCTYFIRTVPALPVNPDKPEDDVDLRAEDHAYDGAGNVLLANPPLPEREAPTVHHDRHPGGQISDDNKWSRRKRAESLEEAMTNAETGERRYALPHYQAPRRRG